MKAFLSTLKSYWLLILFLVLTIGLCVGYMFGYRLDQGGITRAGTLEITGVPVGSSLYIDAARVIPVTGPKTSLSLTPGTHSIIVQTQKYLPWNEIFTITQATTTHLVPILLTEKPRGKALAGAEASAALERIRMSTIPTEQAPLIVADGCARVYLSGTHIVSERATTTPCTNPPPYLCNADTDTCAPVIVYSPKGPIRSIIPFPGRQDALVVSAGNLVYVVELDPRAPQYFSTIFKGPTIGVIPGASSTVIVSNGTQVVEVSL